MIDPHIFRAYDIRGKALTQLTAEAAYLIGKAFGSVLHDTYSNGNADYHPTVALGRDARTHGPDLEAQMKRGLMEAGCTVLLIGPTPSPVNYFTINHAKLDAGVQITASHNPKEDNGIKLQIRDAESFSGDDLQRLRERIERGEFHTGKGSEQTLDAITPYMDALGAIFEDVGRGKKIVVDAGNGIAGPVNVRVLRRIGCEVIELYTEPDGNFPNHPADPSKHATLKELQERVISEQADCGFAYDGDGDRMGLIDERGVIVTADQTLLLLAQDHLMRHAGAPIIFTVSNSTLLQTEVAKWGGVPVMTKVGHSYVEHAMHEHHAKLGGEQSGHFFCGENYYGFDDALAASLRVLAIIATPRAGTPAAEQKKNKEISSAPVTLSRVEGPGRGGRSLSAMIDAFPKVYQAHERRPHCPDNRKAAIIAALTATFQKTYPVDTLDGARVDFGDGAWAGIRMSNTSPCLSICIEARSLEKLRAVEGIVVAELRTFKEVAMEY